MHKGESNSTFNIPVNVVVGARGQVQRLDGTGPSQQFLRLRADMDLEGRWLINPCTNELHRVISTGSGGIVIEAKGHRSVSWLDAMETLLLVEP